MAAFDLTPEAAFTPAARLEFWLKSRLLMLARLLRDGLRPPGFASRRVRFRGEAAPLCEIRTPLYAEVDPAEATLQLGKVENLRVVARRLDGLVIRRGQVFGFWHQVGRPSRGRGFVPGRELRHGCIIPTIAGGICQMSNSLHHVARTAGMAILERHSHTSPVPGAAFPPGEDATVFWNYIDLRFRAPADVVLHARLTATELVVGLGRLP
ncbi:VanW family protein [Zavarzinia compransoris]|nr:VanW family protein [Zavarzinia compransoris]TDP48206.1 VanW like protein [Zavarzinia compransoris]